MAQTVIRMALEPVVDNVFHPDSYGYRPYRAPHDALRVCRERCWEKDWVVDLDVKAFFDTVPWDLMLKAVAHHTEPFSSCVCLADLQYVDGLGELAGAPGAAAELAEDAPGLELGVRALAG